MEVICLHQLATLQLIAIMDAVVKGITEQTSLVAPLVAYREFIMDWPQYFPGRNNPKNN